MTQANQTTQTPSNVVPIGTAPTEPAAAVEPAAAAKAAAPEAAKAAAPEATKAAAPEGQAVECDPAAAAPGEIVQLLIQFPAGTVLKGLVLGEGLVPQTVIVGRMRFPGPDGPTWDACYGRAVPDQAWVILLAKNETPDTLIARATWYVTTGGAPIQRTPGPVMPSAALSAQPAPAAPPQVTAANPFQTVPYAQAPVQPASPTLHGTTQQGTGLNMAPAAPLAGASPALPRVVVPGTNEVVVLLQRSECQRLIDSLSPDGQSIDHHHQPSIMRQLLAAMAR